MLWRIFPFVWHKLYKSQCSDGSIIYRPLECRLLAVCLLSLNLSCLLCSYSNVCVDHVQTFLLTNTLSHVSPSFPSLYRRSACCYRLTFNHSDFFEDGSKIFLHAACPAWKGEGILPKPIWGITEIRYLHVDYNINISDWII